jgi:hypothetical protein
MKSKYVFKRHELAQSKAAFYAFTTVLFAPAHNFLGLVVY